jgi:hypothetical protein
MALSVMLLVHNIAKFSKISLLPVLADNFEA